MYDIIISNHMHYNGLFLKISFNSKTCEILLNFNG